MTNPAYRGDLRTGSLRGALGPGWAVATLPSEDLCEEAARLGPCGREGSAFLLEEVSSTNRAARRMLNTALPSSRWLVVAGRQTAGYGRLNRGWHSVEGGSLCFSLVQELPGWRKRPGLVSLLAALAVFDAAATALPGPSVLDLRWPNDLLLSGRKAAGILVEGPGEKLEDLVVVGVGLNARAMEFPPELSGRAATLAEAADRNPDRSALLRAFVDAFDRHRPLLEGGGAGLLDAFERRSGCARGKAVRFLRQGEWRNAVSEGLGPDGALLVRLGDGSRVPLSAAEIEAMRPGE